jgi:hypothetical protein
MSLFACFLLVVVNGRRKLSAKISYRLDINNIAMQELPPTLL